MDAAGDPELCRVIDQLGQEVAAAAAGLSPRLQAERELLGAVTRDENPARGSIVALPASIESSVSPAGSDRATATDGGHGRF